MGKLNKKRKYCSSFRPAQRVGRGGISGTLYVIPDPDPESWEFSRDPGSSPG